MVPGFAERERRIADAQRLDWLAEARDGQSSRRRPIASTGGVLGHRRATASLRDLALCLRRIAPRGLAPSLAR